MILKKNTVLFLLAAVGSFVMYNFAFSMEPDTVRVPTLYNGVMNGAFNNFIMGDTSNTGERNNPNRVYMVYQDSVYFIDKPMDINFNFTLTADGRDAGKRPPMILRGVDPEGVTIRTFFHFIGDSINVKLKGVIFQGVKQDEQIEERGPSMMQFVGVGYHMLVDSCVFNGWTGNNVSMRKSSRSSYIFKNNIFRNGAALTSIFSGTIFSEKETHQDSLVMINNTFFNIGGYLIVSITNDLIDYVEFIHNTVYNTTTNGLWMPYLTHALIRDNIFYNYQTAAQTQFEIESGYFDHHKQISSICRIYDLSEEVLAEWGKTERDRVVEYQNNVYAWSQTIKDYWANEKDEYTGLDMIPPTWMNEPAIAAFSDKDKYPRLVEENNAELDPGFDPAIDTEIMKKELSLIKLYRKYGNKGFADKAQDRYYHPDGTGLYNLTWPLPENFSYSNETVKSYARGSFPAGDLNWFPEKKTEWSEWVKTNPDMPVGIEEVDKNVPNSFTLDQNYPNPFNPTTNITFSIPVSGNVVLSVYNILGQKVATLVNGQLSAGNYAYKFDGTNFSSGVYFYQLQSENNTQIKKMMLLK